MAREVSTRAILARSWTRTLVIGHRGAADDAPENTLHAFEAGMMSGADAVECDVHLSADGEIVVIHDATLERTTLLTGRVDATLSASIYAEGVPSLAQVARLTRDRCVLAIEIKDGDGIESRVIDLLRKQRMANRSILFSFHDDRLARAKSMGPGLTTVWLLSKNEVEKGVASVLNRLKTIQADGVGCDLHDATPEFVEGVHRAGFPIFVWTVPPGPDVDRLKRMRVNFIITNDPRNVKIQIESRVERSLRDGIVVG